MIYVRIELWPFGDRDRRAVLGEMVIANDGTGTKNIGNYNVWSKTDPKKLLDNQSVPQNSMLLRSWIGKMQPKRVEFHDRELRIWELIRKAIESVGFKRKLS